MSDVSWFNLLTEGRSPSEWADKIKSGSRLPWEATIHELVEGSSSVLSLGCGIGNVCAPLALRGVRTCGIDLSRENVHFAKELFSKLGAPHDFRPGSITDPLPFADGSFDFVYSCTVFQFFDDDAIVRTLREAMRVAQKRVVVVVPNSRCLLYRIGKWHMARTGRWKWGKERSFGSLREHFRRAGAAHDPREFTVAPRHALDFVHWRGGRTLKRVAQKAFGPHDSPRPAQLGQGYMLVSVWDKA